MTETAATQFTTSADGTRIAYEKSGSGPAVILVDGAMCYRDFNGGRPIAKHLVDRFTVYLYDRRGRGESGATEPYAVEREIEDLASVIAAAGGDAAVAGQSSGAALAIEAAASGVPMRALAAYEPPYVGVTPIDGRSPDYFATLQNMLAHGRHGAMVDYFLVRMVGAPGFLPVMLRIMVPIWRRMKQVAPTLLDDTRILDGFEVDATKAERFSRISVPALIMVGGKAKPNMVKGVTDAAAAVTGQPPRILDGQPHTVAPAVLAAELGAFFAEEH